jgi:hypothetical protein
MSTSKIIFFARLCRLVSIAVAVTWLLNSFISVVPKLEKAHQTISIVLSCGFLFFVSSSAILYGIANGCKPRIKDSKAKRVVARLLFFVLIFAGVSLMNTGHSLYVKAKVRESEKTEILEKHGHYENPCWEQHLLCDIGGIACFGILGLWVYVGLLHKMAERFSRCARDHLHISE